MSYLKLLAIFLTTCCLSLARADDPPPVQTSTSEDVANYLKTQGMDLQSFGGYSGAGYNNKAAVEKWVGTWLNKLNPSRDIIGSGATKDGIGQIVYDMAKQKGFKTIGIVSEKAAAYPGDISPNCDKVFYIKDNTWGGFADGSKKLNPTSQAWVDNSKEVHYAGGNDVAGAEMYGAKQAGVPVDFVAADMNHASAITKAAKQGKPAPTDFSGTADQTYREMYPSKTVASVDNFGRNSVSSSQNEVGVSFSETLPDGSQKVHRLGNGSLQKQDFSPPAQKGINASEEDDVGVSFSETLPDGSQKVHRLGNGSSPQGAPPKVPSEKEIEDMTKKVAKSDPILTEVKGAPKAVEVDAIKLAQKLGLFKGKIPANPEAAFKFVKMNIPSPKGTAVAVLLAIPIAAWDTYSACKEEVKPGEAWHCKLSTLTFTPMKSMAVSIGSYYAMSVAGTLLQAGIETAAATTAGFVTLSALGVTGAAVGSAAVFYKFAQYGYSSMYGGMAALCDPQRNPDPPPVLCGPAKLPSNQKPYYGNDSEGHEGYSVCQTTYAQYPSYCSCLEKHPLNYCQESGYAPQVAQDGACSNSPSGNASVTPCNAPRNLGGSSWGQSRESEQQNNTSTK